MLEKIVSELREAKVKDLSDKTIDKVILNCTTNQLTKNLVKYGYLTINDVYCECPKCQKRYTPCL